MFTSKGNNWYFLIRCILCWYRSQWLHSSLSYTKHYRPVLNSLSKVSSVAWLICICIVWAMIGLQNCFPSPWPSSLWTQRLIGGFVSIFVKFSCQKHEDIWFYFDKDCNSSVKQTEGGSYLVIVLTGVNCSYFGAARKRAHEKLKATRFTLLNIFSRDMIHMVSRPFLANYRRIPVHHIPTRIETLLIVTLWIFL